MRLGLWGRGTIVLGVCALALWGCGASEGDPELTLYLDASANADGVAAARTAQMALEAAGGEAGGVAVRLEVVRAPRAKAWRAAGVGMAARTATRDSTAIAYVGELDPRSTRTSAPITNEAGLLQIQPGPAAATLTRSAPGSSQVPDEVQPSGSRTLIQLGPPRSLPAKPPPNAAGIAHGYEERYGEKMPVVGAYAYEAVALALDAIDRAEDPLDRSAVVSSAFGITDRKSILGTYSIDDVGDAEFSGG